MTLNDKSKLLKVVRLAIIFCLIVPAVIMLIAFILCILGAIFNF